jgi:hypothetical protein
VTRFQRFNQRSLVNESAPRDIDEYRALFSWKRFRFDR